MDEKTSRRGYLRRKRRGGTTYVRATLVARRKKKQAKRLIGSTHRCACGDTVFRRGGGVFNAVAWPQLIPHSCATRGRDVTAGKTRDMGDLFDGEDEEPLGSDRNGQR